MDVKRAPHSRLHQPVERSRHRARPILLLTFAAVVLAAVPPSGAQTQVVSINRDGTASGSSSSGGAARNHVEALIRSGRVPADIGQQLLSGLDRILAVLEGVATGEPCPPSL